MSIEIIVPALGESVSEATIAKWYKKEGDSVKADELLVELETEKVTLEVNASVSGVVKALLFKDGDSVTPGQKLGEIEEGAAAQASTGSDTVNEAKAATSVNDENLESKAMDQLPTGGISGSNNNDPSTFGPATRKLIDETGVDASLISATGKDGRLTKVDVQNFVDNKIFAQASAPAISERIVGHTSENGKDVEVIKMSRLRKTIAQRLKESQNTAAILSTFNEIDMSNVIALRNNMRDEFKDKHGVKLGFMSFFTKAVVLALQEVPSVNAEIRGDDIIYKKYYDIGVAVGTEQGLVVPVVRGCDKLSFAGIEKNIAELAGKARSGKLSMNDLSGGTFSITNGGVYGSLLSTPIINPPQTGILGLHNTQDRPVAINGKVEIRPMMYIALSYDHRIIDGKDAVGFLVSIKKSIENPERLLLGI